MSGFVIDQVAILTCPHSVPATPNQSDARVSVIGHAHRDAAPIPTRSAAPQNISLHARRLDQGASR